MKPLAYAAPILLVLVLGGCQKPKQETPEPKEAATVPVTQPQNPDLCQPLLQHMQAINANSRIEALEQVNQRLSACLSQLPFKQQKQLLEASHAMYQHFLKVERSPAQQEAFDQYAFNQSPHPTLQQSYIDKFAPRDQYLLQHQGGAAYYELYDSGEGMLNYRRQPRYLVELFAPYLPVAERTFIEHLAEQNQQSPLRDGALNISWDEIAQRAQFWEDYIQQYPDSSYHEDAKLLLALYSAFLFKGANNTPISDTYTGELSVRPDALTVIRQVSKQRNSELAQQAKRFLEFVEMSPAQRNQTITVQLTTPERLSGQRNILTLRQLEKYLQLRDPYAGSKYNQYRDCLTDAVCISPAQE